MPSRAMRLTAMLLVLLILVPQVASAGIQIKMVRAYEVSKWEYFKVGIKNNEASQKLTVKVRAYDAVGYEKYRVLDPGVLLYKEDDSVYLGVPAFSQTASDWWGAGAYREVLLRWVISPCTCKRFKEYPIVVIVEVFRGSDGTRVESTEFVMWSEYFYGTRS